MSDFGEVLESPLWPALKSGIIENPGSLPQLILLVKAINPLLGEKIEKDTVGFISMVQATVAAVSVNSTATEAQEQTIGQDVNGNDWATELWESIASDLCHLSDPQQPGQDPHFFEFDDL